MSTLQLKRVPYVWVLYNNKVIKNRILGYLSCLVLSPVPISQTRKLKTKKEGDMSKVKQCEPGLAKNELSSPVCSALFPLNTALKVPNRQFRTIAY